MASFEKKLHVTKTDTYSLTVSSEWLEGETITSHAITVPSQVTLNSSGIIDAAIYVSVTGVAAGSAPIHFEWVTTSGRSDCMKVNVKVIADC